MYLGRALINTYTNHQASLTTTPMKTSCKVVASAKWKNSHWRPLHPRQLIYNVSKAHISYRFQMRQPESFSLGNAI